MTVRYNEKKRKIVQVIKQRCQPTNNTLICLYVCTCGSVQLFLKQNETAYTCVLQKFGKFFIVTWKQFNYHLKVNLMTLMAD